MQVNFVAWKKRLMRPIISSKLIQKCIQRWDILRIFCLFQRSLQKRPSKLGNKISSNINSDTAAATTGFQEFFPNYSLNSNCEHIEVGLHMNEDGDDENDDESDEENLLYSKLLAENQLGDELWVFIGDSHL